MYTKIYLNDITARFHLCLPKASLRAHFMEINLIMLICLNFNYCFLQLVNNMNNIICVPGRKSEECL